LQVNFEYFGQLQRLRFL